MRDEPSQTPHSGLAILFWTFLFWPVAVWMILRNTKQARNRK